jgi:ribosomal protein S18 acetylase RimI-like enzyme
LPPDNAAFVAIADGAPNATGIGMCGAFVDSDVRVALVAMWVAPSARGTSVAERLLNHVVDFAQELGAGEVAAWVVENNHRALEFYRKNSFQHEGLRQPYAPDPSKDELLTVRRL